MTMTEAANIIFSPVYAQIYVKVNSANAWLEATCGIFLRIRQFKSNKDIHFNGQAKKGKRRKTQLAAKDLAIRIPQKSWENCILTTR